MTLRDRIYNKYKILACPILVEDKYLRLVDLMLFELTKFKNNIIEISQHNNQLIVKCQRDSTETNEIIVKYQKEFADNQGKELWN